MPGISLKADADGAAGEAIVADHIARSTACFRSGQAGPDVVTRDADAVPGEGHGQKRSADNQTVHDEESPEEKKIREKMERFHHQEEVRAQKAAEKKKERDEACERRKREAQESKERRQEEAKTPHGRAKVWLHQLQEHISKCNSALSECQAPGCALPKGLAREYQSTWSSKLSALKKARSTIEAILNGSKQVPDFQSVVSKAEASVRDFKADYQRFRMLLKSYERKKKSGNDDVDDE